MFAVDGRYGNNARPLRAPRSTFNPLPAKGLASTAAETISLAHKIQDFRPSNLFVCFQFELTKCVCFFVAIRHWDSAGYEQVLFVFNFVCFDIRICTTTATTATSPMVSEWTHL